MKKLLFLPIFAAFLSLYSCDNDGCECTRRSYNYDGDYPVSSVKVVDCPDGIKQDEDIIEWREDGRIDYVTTKTCI